MPRCIHCCIAVLESPRVPQRSLLSNRRVAFTLVELIVVIGIIALLVAILLPMLLKAWRASHAVNCASNLQQWAVTTTLFANEHHGEIPRRGQGVQPTNIINRTQDWFNALPPMLHLKQYQELAADNAIARPGGDRSIWVCPQANDFPGAYYWSYGMNMGLSVEQASENNGQPAKVTNVGNTATMVLFTDAPGNYCSVFPSMTAGGYNPVARHNGRVNICFVDGHVAAFDAKYIGIGAGLIEHDDVRWHPPNSQWNSAR